MSAPHVALPGWFGKLPGMGDFAHRRLPESFRERWDGWLHDGLMRLRERHDDWTVRYLEAPLWCFVLGRGVAGDGRWIGVLMPSVDGVGRYFPFTVAVAFDDVAPPMRTWWALASQAALQGLEQDLDAVRFDALLLQRFEADASAVDAASVDDDTHPSTGALPVPGQALWFTAPGDAAGVQMATGGLPQGTAFDALFGWGEAAPVMEPAP